jgi:hypothetical protein
MGLERGFKTTSRQGEIGKPKTEKYLKRDMVSR